MPQERCRKEYRRERGILLTRFITDVGLATHLVLYSKGASKALFGDPNVLLEDPERVAKEEDVASGAAPSGSGGHTSTETVVFKWESLDTQP